MPITKLAHAARMLEHLEGQAMESNVARTPGPWTVRYRTEVYAGPVLIADCSVIHGASLQEQANARFIATGPQMLETLKKALAYLNQEDDCDDVSEVHDAIEDAIEKATGVPTS